MSSINLSVTLCELFDVGVGNENDCIEVLEAEASRSISRDAEASRSVSQDAATDPTAELVVQLSDEVP